jgi:hypothetical protein
VTKRKRLCDRENKLRFDIPYEENKNFDDCLPDLGPESRHANQPKH